MMGVQANCRRNHVEVSAAFGGCDAVKHLMDGQEQACFGKDLINDDIEGFIGAVGHRV